MKKRFRYKAALSITVLFLVFMIFFAPNSVVKTIDISHNIDSMQIEHEALRESSRRDSIFIENLRHDEFLEKFARERLFMKREGEQIYVIEEIVDTIKVD